MAETTSTPKRAGGRPEVGPPIHVRLWPDLLAVIDEQRAQADDGAGVSRAEYVRRELAKALGVPAPGQVTVPDVPSSTYRYQLYPTPGRRTCAVHPERPAVGRTLTRRAGAPDQRPYACRACWASAEPWTSRRLDVTTSGGGS